MGESREPHEENPIGDWLGMIASTQDDPELRFMADRLRQAGPPPLLGVPRHSFLIIDTDIGGDPDDAIALTLAALRYPELALVVTSDECGGQRARFARHLLDLLARRDVPVIAGADLGNSRYFCVEELVPDTVPPQPTDLAERVHNICTAATLPVRWVGMGPLTNLDRLLATAPELASRLELTQMGGALRYRDPTRAEHNFRLDPDAACRALGMVERPRLVTSDVTFTPELAIDAESELYRALATPEAPAWAALLRTHLDRWYARFHPASIQHDALTLSAAMELPFVGLTRATITLDHEAKMTRTSQGIPVRLSTRALHRPFLNWLTTQIADAIHHNTTTSDR